MRGCASGPERPRGPGGGSLRRKAWALGGALCARACARLRAGLWEQRGWGVGESQGTLVVLERPGVPNAPKTTLAELRARTRTHTDAPTHARPRTRARAHTHTRTHTHPHTQTHRHTHTHITDTHTGRVSTRKRPRTHKHIHTHTHARTHTHASTFTYLLTRTKKSRSPGPHQRKHFEHGRTDGEQRASKTSPCGVLLPIYWNTCRCQR